MEWSNIEAGIIKNFFRYFSGFLFFFIWYFEMYLYLKNKETCMEIT